ncbi:hypothetical protein AVEN_203123-1 [Araneus ventricosus]|uniref:Uncharacterized protein n=1 Tax=Araneus ventricosus TaxID=182803 RepID=A0A4Y2DPW5_ARAVE|nr:hypothetical protein AVEN_203123-1 [Araneus ventricosus]
MARRNHADDFACGRMINRLEEGCSLVSVTQEFGIDHMLDSRAWTVFQNAGAAVRKVGGGWTRKTTTMDNRYTVLLAKRDRQESASKTA